MTTYIWIDEKWVEGEPTTHGQKIKCELKSGGSFETFYNEHSKSDEETEWQHSELKKYDNKLQPDRPNAARILEYREELRQYILHVDFPNGTRPTL